MNLQSSLFWTPAPIPQAAPLGQRVLELLASGERTAAQISATLGADASDALAQLLDSDAVRTGSDGFWWLPWGSPDQHCERCSSAPDTLLCSCGHNPRREPCRSTE